MACLTDWFDLARDLLETRRRTPADDAMSLMLRAHVDGLLERSDDEMILEALLLLHGGSNTTTVAPPMVKNPFVRGLGSLPVEFERVV